VAVRGVASFLDDRGGVGIGCCSPRLCCPLRLALFLPAAGFFSSAYSGSSVDLGSLVAKLVVVVGILPWRSPRRLEATCFVSPFGLNGCRAPLLCFAALLVSARHAPQVALFPGGGVVTG
jgi:hypothetical protein